MFAFNIWNNFFFGSGHCVLKSSCSNTYVRNFKGSLENIITDTDLLKTFYESICELLCYGFKEDRTQVIGNKHLHLSLYKYRYLSMSAWFYIIYNSKTSGFTSNSSLRCPDTKARNDSLISIRLSVSIYWLKIKEWLMSKRHQRNQLKLIDCKHGKLLFILKNTQFTKRKRVCQLHL